METIRRDDVPAYLRSGALFENLDSSDEESFEVPSDCYKKDPNVTNVNELSYVLRSARFWGLDNPPYTVVSYLVRRESENTEEDFKSFMNEFPEYSTFLFRLFFVRQEEAEKVIPTAVEMGLGEGMVKHLREQDSFPLTSEAFVAAIEVDDAVAMKYIASQGIVWPTDSVCQMLTKGSLRCVKYTFETFKFDTTYTISYAVASEQMGVLRYLLDVGIKPDPTTMPYAILRGNLEIVRMLHRAGCAWPEGTIFTCMVCSHMDCLIYAHESGCLLTPDLCNIAAILGKMCFLEYARLHGFPWGWDELTD